MLRRAGASCQQYVGRSSATRFGDGVKLMIGGAPTTRAWTDDIGGDGYSEDAIEAVNAAKGPLGVEAVP